MLHHMKEPKIFHNYEQIQNPVYQVIVIFIKQKRHSIFVLHKRVFV